MVLKLFPVFSRNFYISQFFPTVERLYSTYVLIHQYFLLKHCVSNLVSIKNNFKTYAPTLRFGSSNFHKKQNKNERSNI